MGSEDVSGREKSVYQMKNISLRRT